MSDRRDVSTHLRPGFFLTGNAWLAEGFGSHSDRVWIAHDCVGHREVHLARWPTWRAVGDHVEPSYQCDLCGFHATVFLGAPERETTT